jgi:hypothetical protein
MENQVEQMCWRRASHHIGGRGLDSGGDLAPAQALVGGLRKKGKHQVASLVGAIVAGGVWCDVREFEAV